MTTVYLRELILVVLATSGSVSLGRAQPHRLQINAIFIQHNKRNGDSAIHYKLLNVMFVADINLFN